MTAEPEQVKEKMKETYGRIAKAAQGGSCCGGKASENQSAPTPQGGSCCGPAVWNTERDQDQTGNLGLGCGNPLALASLKSGEVVLDLGSGGGFDCFQAARRVGPTGRVIGVDMTQAMIDLALENRGKAGLDNVEFRLGEIERLPADDESVDVIISNCVLNLSQDKQAAWAEVFRVLKPGGRVSVADIVATASLPDKIKADLNLNAGCVGGAAMVDDIQVWMKASGFVDVRIEINEASRETIDQWFPGRDAGRYVASATIEAKKPRVTSSQEAESNTLAEMELAAREIRKKAYRHLESGYHCAEAVLQASLESLGCAVPVEVIRASSGFGGGIVGTMSELCGAFTGGVLAAGVVLGREAPDESMHNLKEIVNEFKARFESDFGSLNCPNLMRGFQEEEDHLGCARLSARAAALLVDVFQGYQARTNLDLTTCACQSREKVALGACPFS